MKIRIKSGQKCMGSVSCGIGLNSKSKNKHPRGENWREREKSLNYHGTRAGLRNDKDPGEGLRFSTFPRKTLDQPLKAIPSYLNLCCSSFSDPHVLLACSSFSDFPSSSGPPPSACFQGLLFLSALSTCTFFLSPASTCGCPPPGSPSLTSHAVSPAALWTHP